MPFWRVCLLCLLLATSLQAQPRTDHHGDPLPDGAVARLGTVRLRHHSGYGLMGMACSPDGKVFATTGFDVGARLWDAATGKPLRQLDLPPHHTSGGISLTFSNDGTRLVTGTFEADNLFLWEVATGK